MTQNISRTRTDAGIDGPCVGGYTDANDRAEDYVLGTPLARERLWRELFRSQRLHRHTLSEPALAAIDCALCDIAGKQAGMPVYRLLEATRREFAHTRRRWSVTTALTDLGHQTHGTLDRARPGATFDWVFIEANRVQ